jgi:putative membrane protein
VNSGFTWFVRGIPLGLANLVPGISGGTVAFLLGYYSELLKAVRRLRWRQLLPLLTGAGISIFAGSYFIVDIIGKYPRTTNAVILGLIAGSVWLIFYQVPSYKRMGTMAIGLMGFLVALFLTDSLRFVSLPKSHWGSIMMAGCLSGCALLLPGISGAAILVALGSYTMILDAVTKLSLTILVPYAVGAVVGIIGLSWVVSCVLQKAQYAALGFLGGMLLGSVRSLVFWNWNLQLLMWFVGGVLFVLTLDYFRG